MINTTWLDIAITHAKTKWLGDFICEYFPQLQARSISIEEFAAAFERLLIDRHLETLAQQKNPRSNLVQALKTLDPHHPAIALISLTTEQYRTLNEAQQGKLANRQARYLTDPEGLVTRAIELLDSSEWSDIAAGLAILIGRRISEILLSKFTPSTPWSLNFSEMSKKSIEHQIAIEIPTLAPASIVLNAIDKLQHTLNITDLKLDSLTPAVAKKKVSDKYSQAVSAKCDLHYQGLIPTRSDREQLYTHMFRAVYCTIATHWFCPSHIPDYAYRAEIMGHYTIPQGGGVANGTNGKKLPDYKAGNNYADYTIGTRDGNRDGRVGIKLGITSELQVLRAFVFKPSPVENPVTPAIEIEELPTPTPTSEPTMASPNSPQSPTKRPELSSQYIDLMVEFWSRLGTTGTISHLFNLTVEHIWSVVPAASQPDRVPQAPIEEPTPAVDFNWVVGEINNLYAAISLNTDTFTEEIEDLHQIIDRLKSTNLQPDRHQDAIIAQQLTSISTLQAENDSLHQGLADLQAENDRLDRELTNLQSKIAQLFGSTPVTITPSENPLPVDSLVNESTSKDSLPIDSPAIATENEDSLPTPKARVNSYKRYGGTSIDKINEIINAIINWNHQESQPDRQLRISISVVKALALAMNCTNQPALMSVLDERRVELESHHSLYALGSRHNRNVDTSTILRKIAKDFLLLDNWQSVCM